jgi:hypothetical protein
MGLVISKGLTLKSYNTPAAIAGVAPTLDYRFALDRREIEAISLTDKLTYTGATNGTFVNRAGLVERATTDQPRFDHGPASRQSLGLLVEESRENLLLRSEEFETTWVNINSTELANVTASPAGALTADRIVEDSGSVTPSLNQAPAITSGVTYTFSCYGKEDPASTKRYLMLMFASSHFGANIRCVADLAAGTVVGVGSPLATSIANVGNGWYRISVTATATASGSPAVLVRMSSDPSGSLSAYTGDGTSGIYLWGAQLETGAFPTSYIPTTTTALTRPVDSAVIDGTGVITGTYTLVEKPAGCAVVNGTNIDLVSGFTAERVMVFPAALSAPQITAIRGAM